MIAAEMGPTPDSSFNVVGTIAATSAIVRLEAFNCAVNEALIDQSDLGWV